MPKINIKATIKGREGSIVSEAVGTLEKGILKYTEKDKTKMTFNYNKNKLIRDTKELRMTFDFEKEELVVKQKELNATMKIKLELFRLEKDNNNVEIEYIVDNTQDKEKLIYRIEELK